MVQDPKVCGLGSMQKSSRGQPGDKIRLSAPHPTTIRRQTARATSNGCWSISTFRDAHRRAARQGHPDAARGCLPALPVWGALSPQRDPAMTTGSPASPARASPGMNRNAPQSPPVTLGFPGPGTGDDGKRQLRKTVLWHLPHGQKSATYSVRSSAPISGRSTRTV